MQATKILTIGAIALCAAAMAACQKDNGAAEPATHPVRFTAADGQAATRASGATWAPGDAIGVFMITTGFETVLEEVANIRYTATTQTAAASTGFAAADPADAICYPSDGSPVMFSAYYPWKEGMTLHEFELAVEPVQTAENQPSFDFMAATAHNGGELYSKTTDGAVEFEFRHMLSKLVMNVSAGPTVGSLDGLTVTVKGMYTGLEANSITETAELYDRQDITPRTVTAGAKYDALVVPTNYDASEVTVEFAVGGKTYVWNPGELKLYSSKVYTYNITLKAGPVAVAVSSSIDSWTTEGGERPAVEVKEAPGVKAVPGVIGYYATGPNAGKLTLDGDQSATGGATVYTAYYRWGSLVATGSPNNGIFSAADVVWVPDEYSVTFGALTYYGIDAMKRRIGGDRGGPAWDKLPSRALTDQSEGWANDAAAGLGDPCEALGGGWYMPTAADNIAFTGAGGSGLDIAPGTRYSYTANGESAEDPAFGVFPQGTPPGAKLPAAGYRRADGAAFGQGDLGNYWSSAASGSGPYLLHFADYGMNADFNADNYKSGYPVRCAHK